MTQNTNTETPATPNWAPTAIDREAEAMIQAISAEFVAEPELETLRNDPTGGIKDEISAETLPPPTPEVKESGNPTPKPDPTVAPADLDKYVARELALTKREEALKAKEEAFSKLKPIPDEIGALFNTSAAQALEKLGYDPDQIVRRVIAERMGDKAPEKLRKEIEDADREHRYTRRIDEIEQRLAMKERELQARAYYDHVSNGAKDYISKGINEHAPILATIAKTNPDRVHREIMDEITRDAQVRSQHNPDGDVLSYEEASKRVEARWTEYRNILGIKLDTSTKTEPLESKTITHTPSRSEAPVTRAPDRPLAPWLQSKPIEDEGVKAGLAEYYRIMKEGEKR